jgi:hypothetical protein
MIILPLKTKKEIKLLMRGSSSFIFLSRQLIYGHTLRSEKINMTKGASPSFLFFKTVK